jgi:uncharacterized protein
MIFKNQQVPVSELPHVEEVVFQSLAPNTLKARYWAAGIVIGCVSLLGLGILPPVFSHLWWLGILIILVAGGLALAGTTWLIRKRFEGEGYALRDYDIIHRHGYFWRIQTTVPFSRVQHVEIGQGPIEKRFGISTIRVFTAGGSNSDLSISGIDPEEAHRIKSFIVHQAGTDDAA